MNDILFEKRYEANSQFNSAMQTQIRNAIVFGTGVSMVDKSKYDDVPLQYVSLKMRDVFLEADMAGNIVTVMHMMQMSKEQIHNHYNLSTDDLSFLKWADENVAATAELKYFNVCHIVSKKGWYGKNYDVPANDKDWNSYHIILQGGKALRLSGYKSNPYIVTRWQKRGSTPYGIGLVESILATIKLLDTNIGYFIHHCGQTVLPTMLTTEEFASATITLEPGQILSGLLTEDGRTKIRPLLEKAQMNSAVEMLNAIDRWERSIKDSFANSEYQYQRNPGNPTTATEVKERTLQKFSLFAGNFSQMADDFQLLVRREMDVLQEFNILPKFLDSALKNAGAKIRFNFKSPLLNAASLAELSSMEQFFGMVGQVLSADPSYHISDFLNLPAWMERIRKILNLDSDLIYTEEEAEDRKDKRNESEQRAQDAATTLKLAQANAQNSQAAQPGPGISQTQIAQEAQ